ncbi:MULTISPECIES: DUF1217 domain-containing protein [Xanthobacter]|uniref:DUF1217 domain-containing protein n=1 Tax=Xanthobacter TaxID=279 RepID=UPI001F3BFD36|nr:MULTISPECIES: DUF1217 domain-containing protein [unclassified Xanthobacter]
MSIYLGTTYATYNYYAKNSDKMLEQQAADPITKNATAYYEENIGKVTSVDDFVSNYRLFNYAMTAYGLSDMVYAKAYMAKVLESDLSDKNSFANKLTDTRFVNFAKAFASLNPDATDTSTTASTESVVNAYMEQSLEDDVGQTDAGVQLALYFKRTASTVSTAFGLLADSAMWKVVSTAYGLPESLGSMDLDTQKTVVESKLDLTDLQDPEKVDKLLARFAALWDITENASSAPILALFGMDTSSSSSSETLALF